MARTNLTIPFNCQHCAAAALRSRRPQLRCTRCGSRIYVPADDAKPRLLRLGRRCRVTGPNLPSRWGRYGFHADSWSDPRLQAFAREFDIAEALRGAADEFSAQVRLRHLLRERWLAKRPSEAFLKRYGYWQANRGNDSWFCTHMARMYVLAAAAAGFPARILNVARRTTGDENCHGHMVVDVWSNQHQRWVYMDVLFDFHYEDRTGRPLSLLEARDAYFRRDARGLFVSTLRSRKGVAPGRYALARRGRDATAAYFHQRSSNLFWCYYYHGQDYFSRPVEQRQVRILCFRDDLNRRAVLRSRGVELYDDEPMIFDTTDPLDVEPLLGNAEIQLYRLPGARDDALHVYVATQTPNLARIRCRLDGGRWRTCDVDGFAVDLPRRGRRVIEAQTVNHAGRRGAISRVCLLPS